MKGWSEVVKILMLVIGAIADLIKRKRDKRRIEDVQKEHNKIEEDPIDWFQTHFGESGDRVRPDDNVATIERSDMSAGGDGVSD